MRLDFLAGDVVKALLQSNNDEGFRKLREKLAKKMSGYFSKRKFVLRDHVSEISTRRLHETFSVRDISLLLFSSSYVDQITVQCTMTFGKNDDREVVHKNSFTPAKDICEILYAVLKEYGAIRIRASLTLVVEVTTSSVSPNNILCDPRYQRVTAIASNSELTMVQSDYPGAPSQ